MDIKEKLITTATPLVVATILKIITHIFNITGEKDKVTKEKIDLLKSTLDIDNSLHISQYKILYEETFSLIFKKNLYFYEIKNLIHLKSPKKAIKVYLNARPYIRSSSSGEGFEYSMWNKIRFRSRILPFPVYGLLLISLYFMCTTLGSSLLIYQMIKINETINVVKMDELYYINHVGLLIISLISMAVGIKALYKLFIIPSRSEIKEALENVKDCEYVFLKNTTSI